MKYEILGENLPVVECTLSAGEKMITEKGAMSWMSPNMKMETSSTGGFFKGLARAAAGDSFFQNIYTCESGEGYIAFASSFPGKIIAVEIAPGSEIIAQKSAFLATTEGVKLEVTFKQKLGVGFFGGEGFIMQKLSGQGTAFLEIDGSVVKKTLAGGEKIVVDTGCLAAMSSTCTMDIQKVPGMKNMLFGGEGIFNTVITGPGDVYLQTMPLSGFMGLIISHLPKNN